MYMHPSGHVTQITAAGHSIKIADTIQNWLRTGASRSLITQICCSLGLKVRRSLLPLLNIFIRPLHSPEDCNVVGVPFLLSNWLLY